MKKYIFISFIAICLFFLIDAMVYEFGFYLPIPQNTTTFVKTDGKKILLNDGQGYKDFEIKGVDLGVGYPGKAATDYAVDKDTYKRWFKQIQDMGANTIRIYTINSDTFYDAFYEYNEGKEQPLYLLHGLWLNDYILNSHRDALEAGFMGQLISDGRTMIDVIHGKRTIFPNENFGNGNYRKDISKWVIGYILGVEWEDTTVEYTNQMKNLENHYNGKYLLTEKDATPFEAMLAQVGDKIIDYEDNKYGVQKLVAFSNWPTTDPLDYSKDIIKETKKFAKVDVEHIQTTDKLISGTFASYHVYPYFPDYLNFDERYKDSTNTYYEYLKLINLHHTIPVVISEFGIPSSRGMAQEDQNTKRNQGFMNEKQQGQALIDCYQDIKKAGCAGSVVFSWQDEWFKRTWNTMYAVDLEHTKNWSDYQTNEQYFGLLSFDPGEKESVCYVDGKTTEWSKNDVVIKQGDYTLSMKYDEKFIYMKIDGYQGDKLYIPIDTLDSIGSQTMNGLPLRFDKKSDFVIEIDGKENSRIFVNHRYNTLLAMNSPSLIGKNIYLSPPNQYSDQFDKIQLMLQFQGSTFNTEKKDAVTYETGKLLYGNANPQSSEFDSLADFCINESQLELKIPWQLLNFSNPSMMVIHDDYYLHYGVENKTINQLFIGLGDEKTELISMNSFELKGWRNQVTFHERLKESYYQMKSIWNK